MYDEVCALFWLSYHVGHLTELSIPVSHEKYYILHVF